MTSKKRLSRKNPEAIAARAVQLLDGQTQEWDEIWRKYPQLHLGMPLMSDGFSRALSLLLKREGVEHELHIGVLQVEGVGRIDMHCWIQLAGGMICDGSARMWLGVDPRVPHGVFVPDVGHQYDSRRLQWFNYVPDMFWEITGKNIDEFVL